MTRRSADKDRRLKMISVNVSRGRHNGTVMEDDSLMFLNSCGCCLLPPGGTALRLTQIVSNED